MGCRVLGWRMLCDGFSSDRWLKQRWARGTTKLFWRWNCCLKTVLIARSPQSNLALIPKLIRDSKNLRRKVEEKEKKQKKRENEENSGGRRRQSVDQNIIHQKLLLFSTQECQERIHQKAAYHNTKLCLNSPIIGLGLNPNPTDTWAYSPII
jgi:hypothetical protein